MEPIQAQYAYRDFFTYETDFSALAAAGSATQTFQIQADSDFIWHKGTFVADIAAAAQTDSTRVIPLVTCLITDSGAGRQLMNSAVPIPSLFGNGQIPFILPRPRVFRASSVVTVQLTSYVAAGTTYNLRLSFIGEKGFWK
jgi:hypothetical protein